MALAILLALVLGVLWVGVFGLGAVVTWRGLRGRVVDEHPRCARCRYRIDAGTVRPERCPECGGSLRGVGAVRLGRRKAHPPLIAAGALVMLASLTPTGLLFNAAPPAAAPLLAAGPAVRPMTPEQAALLRQIRKDEAARVSREEAARLDDDLFGPPLPGPTGDRITGQWTDPASLFPRETASAPPAAAGTFGAVAAPPEHDADWMTRSLGHLIATGAATPSFVPGQPSEPSAPSAPAPPGAAAPAFVAGIDSEAMSFERGAGTGVSLGEHKLLRNGFPLPPGASPMRSGRYDPWEIAPAIGGVSTFASPFAGATLLPSTRVDHRVAPAYLGARPALRPSGPSPGAPAPAGPRAIDIRPARMPTGR